MSRNIANELQLAETKRRRKREKLEALQQEIQEACQEKQIKKKHSPRGVAASKTTTAAAASTTAVPTTATNQESEKIRKEFVQSLLDKENRLKEEIGIEGLFVFSPQCRSDSYPRRLLQK